MMLLLLFIIVYTEYSWWPKRFLLLSYLKKGDLIGLFLLFPQYLEVNKT